MKLQDCFVKWGGWTGRSEDTGGSAPSWMRLNKALLLFFAVFNLRKVRNTVLNKWDPHHCLPGFAASVCARCHQVLFWKTHRRASPALTPPAPRSSGDLPWHSSKNVPVFKFLFLERSLIPWCSQSTHPMPRIHGPASVLWAGRCVRPGDPRTQDPCAAASQSHDPRSRCGTPAPSPDSWASRACPHGGKGLAPGRTQVSSRLADAAAASGQLPQTPATKRSPAWPTSQGDRTSPGSTTPHTVYLPSVLPTLREERIMTSRPNQKLSPGARPPRG